MGHVERFNPALLRLRAMTQAGDLGQVFLVATERIGPFPDRVRDVGVIMDLATHDLDLVRWLGGAPVERVTAETQHRMGREHEDLLLATGRLENTISFNCVVDWLSPTKVRQTRVLGERGMLVADTLTADLTFYENGDVASEWADTQSLRGRLRGRRDALRAGPSRAPAGRARGVLRPARRRRRRAGGDAGRGPRDRARRRGGARKRARRRDGCRRGGHLRAVVVALGKIGLPLATQIARAGHEVVGCDIDAAAVDLVNAAQPPFPGEDGLAEALAEVVGDGRLRATTDTTQAVAGGADLVVAVPPLVVDADARPDFGALDSVLADIGAGLQAGTTVAVETTLPVGTTRNRVAPALARHSGLRAEDEFFSVFSPERVYSGRVFRDLATYPKLLGGLSAAGEARGVKLYRSFLDAEVWPMGSAEAAELTKLAETTYRDVNIALANEFARFADRTGIDLDRVIAAANSQPFSHIHRPGVAVGRALHPGLPALLPRSRRRRAPAGRRARGQPGDAGLRGRSARGRARLPGRRARRHPRRRLPRQRQGDRLQRRLRAARRPRRARRRAARDRPALRRRRAARARLRALGRARGGRAPSCRPTTPATRPWAPTTCPGVRAVVDGRGLLDGARFAAAGVALRRIGGG